MDAGAAGAAEPSVASPEPLDESVSPVAGRRFTRA
jgi:hypothetical protein